MRIVWVFAPIAAFALFVALRAVLGRPLSRRTLDILIALLLLAYLAVTAGLGLFWVARMDLPVFDWHYLFGYALLVVAAAHVSLQLRGIYRFLFRRGTRATPNAVETEPSRRQPGGLTALLGVAVLVALGASYFRAPSRAPLTPPPASQLAAPKRDGASIVDRLFRESSYSRTGLLRSGVVVPQRPSEAKAYAGHARVALPAAPQQAKTTLGAALLTLRSDERASGEAPSLAKLAALLYFANGVTAEAAGLKLRAAASSGALYPTDLYVEPRGVPELAARPHYYDGLAHELVQATTRAGGRKLRTAAPPHPWLEQVPLWFVFGSTFDRTAWKYTVRSYRYLGLDAGHVALNLAVAGAALGLACALEPFFDDEKLAAALELDANNEAPILLLACGGPSRPRHPAVTPRHEPMPLPPGADASELTRLSAHLTTVRLTGGFDWLLAPPVERRAGALSLPPPSQSERDLFEVIRSRRSFREFDVDRPVLARDFSSVLAAASSVFGWLRSVPLVELFVVVRAVEGVEPGTYRYDAERHALSAPIRRGSVPIEAAGLDQALLGRAAFVLAWSLLDERAGSFEGTRDFRHASIEAGLSGETVYLTASALGLGTCGVGAFYDEELGALFAGSGKPPRVLHLTAIGTRPGGS